MLDSITETTVGSLAPDFRLPASTGGEVGLSDYHNRSSVILFFVREYV